MNSKILVLEARLGDYGKAVKELGRLTNNYQTFFKEPKKFGLVLFTGGADVDPSFYNDTSPLQMCSSNLKRDKFEKTIFQCATINNIPMVGICRGFQFLNVMAKGHLLHHINGHGGTIHSFDSPCLKNPIDVNSFHHQMVIPSTDSYIIGRTKKQLSNIYYGKRDQLEKWENPEVEAAIFPKINACGVQYHPEWMSTTSEGFLFFYEMSKRLVDWTMEQFIHFYTTENKEKNSNGKNSANIIHTRHSSIT